MKDLEDNFIGGFTTWLYFNSLIYYIIMFVAPLTLANECGGGLQPAVHYIYAGYAVLTFIGELVVVCRIQARVRQANILNLNKWHFVELLMGQVARFDTYLDVCFFSLMLQCSEWALAIPIGVFILLYVSYPLYTLVRLAACQHGGLKHTLPGIERACNASFIRENMLVATVLDSFCIDNQVTICGKAVPFGRMMGIYTLLF